MPSGDKWLTSLCRDCEWGSEALSAPASRCPSCGSPRLVVHPELSRLTIAHLDCDAFYASVEKRDNPALADRPVIIGGGHRGVVTAACYIARMSGVRSAMPMFQALQACPEAVVIPPAMAKYVKVGRAIRAIIERATPMVEPLSIDEAFLDLAGTERLHGACPAVVSARLVRTIQAETGISVSIGLSHNKLLAKIASGRDKPRGFAVIGRNETLEFLGPLKVSALWGVGSALAHRLNADGIRRIADLRHRSPDYLAARYGSIGFRLAEFAVGHDPRPVTPGRKVKTVSAETTFDRDISDPDILGRRLWPLCEKVASRLVDSHRSGGAVTLKLKTTRFQTITRSRQLSSPTILAGRIFDTATTLLHDACDGRSFRLIGVGVSDLGRDADADQPDLADLASDALARRKVIEATMASIRNRLGVGAIMTGRSLPDGPETDDRGPELAKKKHEVRGRKS